MEITPPNIVYEKGNGESGWVDTDYNCYIMAKDHTNGDTIIFIDQLRTVITGDLVFNKKIPYMADAYIEAWIESF